MAATAGHHEFSLTHGGPFYALLHKVRLRPTLGRPRFWQLGFLVWLPIGLGTLVRYASGMAPDPIVFDLSLHVRLLFALPVMLYGELLLDTTAKSAAESMYRGNYTRPAELDMIFARAERLRDSRWAELCLLAVAILGGQLALWRVFGATGLFHGGDQAGFWSFPRVWYSVVALPIMEFVMFRWFWRWTIWAYVLLQISRLDLDVLATHPDHAGGLAALARPMAAFNGFVLAIAAILSAAWGTQVLAGYTTLRGLLPMLAAFLLVALAVAAGPLLPLTPHLLRGRRKTLAAYDVFARGYVMQFHDKWIELGGGGARHALGSPDIQSLADLANSFAIPTKTRVFVFGPRNVLTLWVAGLVPMAPLFASHLTVEQVLARILQTVLGSFPF